MSSVNKTVLNVAIVLLLAALLDFLPGGGTGASVLIQAVSLAFLGSLAWIAALMYRQHRVDLYALGDLRRATVYVATAVIAVTLTATHRLWSSPTGEIAWFALIGGAVYAAFAVVWSARKY